ALDGHAWGIQFHAEVTRPMIEAWAAAESDSELPMTHEELFAQTDARIGVWNDHGRALCRAFLTAATAGAREIRARPAARDRPTIRATSRRSCGPRTRRHAEPRPRSRS